MHSISKKYIFRSFLLFLALSLGIAIGVLSNRIFSENTRFEKFTESLFQSEVSSNTLTLHYTLANPEKQGIAPSQPSLGTIPSDAKKLCHLCENYEKTLKTFTPSRLSRENQITLDMLLLYFHTQSSLKDSYLMEEYISPSLGIQAQLPVLLAEYAFCTKQDIADYLKLLSQIRPYFQSILDFETQKSLSGFFMCDETLDRTLKQCREFINNPDANYMQTIFAQKLATCDNLSKKEYQKLLTYHQELLKTQVIPAYEFLIHGLENLRGTGTNSRGLCYFDGGREYYQYLIESQIGSFQSVKSIQTRLSSQLFSDFRKISELLRKKPALAPKAVSVSDSICLTPEQMLPFLQKKMQQDFLAFSSPAYELRYVHDSMKDFLSPAFYLTPPVDTGTPNIIYLNNAKTSGNLELFITLAHEAFPGHLYQTVSFARQKPAHIRYLFTSGGYVEGWATYAESYAGKYAATLSKDPDASEALYLTWLNRSVNLCIYSLLDIGIHYHGWDEIRTAAFLKNFGICNTSTIHEIYRYITETPANYLKYYLGSLQFHDLKHYHMKHLGKNFDLKEFHRQILEIGPVQFPVLVKYMNRIFEI